MLERGTFLVPTLTTAHTDPDPKPANVLVVMKDGVVYEDSDGLAA